MSQNNGHKSEKKPEKLSEKSSRSEPVIMRLERSPEQFDKLARFCEDNGLVEPCVQPDHTHAPGEHVTLSQKGAELFDLMAQFVGSRHLTMLAYNATMAQLAEKLGEDLDG